MMTRLSQGVFNTTKLLPPENRMKIRLIRSSPDFCLISSKDVGGKYRVKITDARIDISRVKVEEKVMKSIMMDIKCGSPIYLPFTRLDSRSFEVPAGSRYYRASSLFSGTLPQIALLALTEPDSLGNGSYMNNPVSFPAHKFGVSQIQFFIDERPVLPRPFHPKWEEKKYVYEFTSLLRVTGLLENQVEGSIDYNGFGEDYGIFGVHLYGVDGKQSGTVSVELRFENPTKESFSGLLIPQFRSCLSINASHNVQQTDF